MASKGLSPASGFCVWEVLKESATSRGRQRYRIDTTKYWMRMTRVEVVKKAARCER